MREFETQNLAIKFARSFQIGHMQVGFKQTTEPSRG
jgi:hypothetical protein